MSASARLSAVNSRVPSCPASGTVTVRSSSPGIAAASAASLADAASTKAPRAPTAMDRLRSTTSTPMSPQRFPASPPRAAARPATAAPRQSMRDAATRPARAGPAPARAPAHADGGGPAPSTQSGNRGDEPQRADRLHLLPQPFEDVRHVHQVALVVARQRVDHQVHPRNGTPACVAAGCPSISIVLCPAASVAQAAAQSCEPMTTGLTSSLLRSPWRCNPHRVAVGPSRVLAQQVERA